jgi:hypothetical protein
MQNQYPTNIQPISNQCTLEVPWLLDMVHWLDIPVKNIQNPIKETTQHCQS